MNIEPKKGILKFAGRAFQIFVKTIRCRSVPAKVKNRAEKVEDSCSSHYCRPVRHTSAGSSLTSSI